jgi:nitrogen fixation-related uncharacterized protein
MTEVFQRLTKSSWRDRLKVAFWIAIFVPVILAPIEFVVEMVPVLIAALVPLFAWSFAGAMKNKGFDDPVYKKNLRSLIERNREFEEARKARNEPHS